MTDRHRMLGKASQNSVIWQKGHVTRDERARFFRQQPATVWLTGLSGAGKSTLAFALEHRLLEMGKACYVLDGDNIRHGLNRDLGFSSADRAENIRRIAEVAKLMNEAGLIVITAFISPYRDDREMARQIVGGDRFLEVHVSTPLTVCEARDAKGLYSRARTGLVPEFTGVSAPYESPLQPVLSLDTGTITVQRCLESLLKLLAPFLEPENSR